MKGAVTDTLGTKLGTADTVVQAPGAQGLVVPLSGNPAEQGNPDVASSPVG